MTQREAKRRIVLILEHEPSWVAEFASASGIFAWPLFVWLTDDVTVNGWAWLLPLFGLLFGPTRMGLLFSLKPETRVAAAIAGFIWWSWIIISLFSMRGIVPAHAGYLVPLIADLLTVAKFSVTAAHARRQYVTS